MRDDAKFLGGSSPRIAEPRLRRPDLADRAALVAGGAGRTRGRNLGGNPRMHALRRVAGGEIVVHHRLEALDFAGAARARGHAEGVGRDASGRLFGRRSRRRARGGRLAGGEAEGEGGEGQGKGAHGGLRHRVSARMTDSRGRAKRAALHWLPASTALILMSDPQDRASKDGPGGS